MTTKVDVDSGSVSWSRVIRLWLALIAMVAITLGAVSCGDSQSSDVILATTTSTYDTGLLDMLLPVFEEQTGFNVKPIAVGTGKALAMGERGEADVLLVHAPAAEAKLLESGAALSRKPVMYNYFVLAGPPDDPASARAASAIQLALNWISSSGSDFISRGDDSGTHKMELSLWELAEVVPAGSWYQESGQGMGATLQIASQKAAYTLSDRATFLAQSGVLDLAIVSGRDDALLNTYSVIELNGDRFPEINVKGGKAFAEFLVSPETQAMIRDFGVEQYGEPLFITELPGRAPGTSQ
ncbi:MAG: substrate-binding domain-containing protein [Chloroflexi bacterium]|nr:substrate-binding domain-containing protein [Chloroflexota bacterium]